VTDTLEAEPETLTIIETQVLSVIRLPIEGVPVLRQRCNQGITVLRLIIDDDAVEVEENSGGHEEGITRWGMRSKNGRGVVQAIVTVLVAQCQ
jgi:hypothetical protein